MVTPRVSVVVPAYNSVAFIDATMRSILRQTFTDFELVVSDHSSTDGTWEALQEFTADPRVRLSRLTSGGGAPANWNAVTDLATGEFIKLVCGDDLLSPDSLAEQVAALEAQPGAGRTARRSRWHRGHPPDRASRHEYLRRAGGGVVQTSGVDRSGWLGRSVPLSDRPVDVLRGAAARKPGRGAPRTCLVPGQPIAMECAAGARTC